MKLLPFSRLSAGVFLCAAFSVSCLPPVSADDAVGITLPATDDGLPGAGPIRRYDWFKSLWAERRSAWAKQVEQDQKAIVFLGDSITQGWGDDLRGAFPGMKVANRGISGDTTRGMLMGTNDLEEKAEPQLIAENVKLIIQGSEDAQSKNADRAVSGLSEFGIKEPPRRKVAIWQRTAALS